MNKSLYIAASALLGSSAFLGVAQAEHESETYANVISSKPIIRYVDVSVPREECWNEAVQHRQENDYTTGRTILGGLIGAAIGNQIGRGRGNDAATVVGGLAGAAIGANSAKKDRHSEHYVTQERRCRTVYETRSEERIEGYDVTYRYAGQTYTTQLPYDPGRRLPVQVSVTPAH